MLIVGAILVACVSAFHFICAFVGPAAYRALGAGEAMAKSAEKGSPGPFLFTFGLALVFGLFSIYGFSAAGRLRSLPITRAVIVFAGAVFGLRGLLIVFDVINLARAFGVVAVRNLLYSLVGLVIGLLYLIGLANRSPRITSKEAET
jgi:hypothetical protein